MDLEQLRQFETIEREGTVSVAARALHISQPALSRSLGRLENELGQPLFDRAGRRLVLNDAGRVALEHVQQILRAERAMRDALDDVARRTRALRVGTVAPAPLWPLTALVTERFPGLVLTSQMLAKAEVETGVVDGGLDLGIGLRPIALPAVRSSRLMVENLSVVLPPGHALASRQSVGAAELDGETFLLLKDIGFWRQVCDQYLPHSEFIVQEDHAVFKEMTRSSLLPFFITDAPSFSDFSTSASGRAVVPIRDTAAHATFYLLARTDCRQEAENLFDWVSRQ